MRDENLAAWPRTEQVVSDQLAEYYGLITHVDEQVGRVLDALGASPHADNTIVCLWSDHGWHLGEKQKWHKSTHWEEATRVPLIIVAPGVTKPGTQTTRPASLIDLYPTLATLAVLDAVETHWLKGRRTVVFGTSIGGL